MRRSDTQDMMLPREADMKRVRSLLDSFPVTAILGPRQSGKTTLGLNFKPDHHFDLDNLNDLAALDQPQLTLERLKGLIMIDEIQHKPELFPLIRYLVDYHPKQRYLILGSASASLKRQSGESLAGRIGYHFLSGFGLRDVGDDALYALWIRGGFPRSFLAEDDAMSFDWRENFIQTFLEKDLAALQVSIPAPVMHRFWQMISHYHGQKVNYSEIGRSFGISDKTVKNYLAVLEETFMIRQLNPWHQNLGKRLVRSPKIYVRDSGIFHALHQIKSLDMLLTTPKAGASWEGFALEQVVSHMAKRDHEIYFYATHSGAELDLFWIENGKNYGIEFKYSDTPRMSRSMHTVLSDLQLEKLWVIYPGRRAYAVHERVEVTGLSEFIDVT